MDIERAFARLPSRPGLAEHLDGNEGHSLHMAHGKCLDGQEIEVKHPTGRIKGKAGTSILFFEM